MKEFIYVFAGSGLGGVLRYSISKWMQGFTVGAFPLATLVTNLLACFILGIVIGMAEYKQVISPQTKLLLTVGFCGGFSTFSTFSRESLQLMQMGYHNHNLLYILGSVVLGVVATYAGLMLSTK